MTKELLEDKENNLEGEEPTGKNFNEAVRIIDGASAKQLNNVEAALGKTIVNEYKGDPVELLTSKELTEQEKGAVRAFLGKMRQKYNAAVEKFQEPLEAAGWSAEKANKIAHISAFLSVPLLSPTTGLGLYFVALSEKMAERGGKKIISIARRLISGASVEA